MDKKQISEQVKSLMQAAFEARQTQAIESALLFAKRAAEVALENLGNTNELSLDALEFLADCFRSGGQLEESIALEKQVIEFRKKILDKSNPALLCSLLALAQDNRLMKKWTDARGALQEVYIIASEAYGQGSKLAQKAALELAILESDDGRHEEALRVLTDTIRAASEMGLECLALEEKIREVKEEKEQHKEYYSLSDSARKYAYTCAELSELIEGLPKEQLVKIKEEERLYYRIQAQAVTCYQKHLQGAKFPQPRFETMGMQSLMGYKYLMPSLSECIVCEDKVWAKALVTWIENHLCLIVTVITDGRPIDSVKDLNEGNEGEKIVEVKQVMLSLEGEQVEVIVEMVDGEKKQWKLDKQ